VHPGALTTSQPSEWVRDELERMARSHPYRHLEGLAYREGRLEVVERAWRAGLIRQVDKWIEWHDSGECPAQGTGEGPGDTAGGAEGGGGESEMDGAPTSSTPGARKRPLSPSPDAAGKSTTTEPITAQEASSHGGGWRQGPAQPALQGESSSTREGPGRPALEELLGVIDRLCKHGDGCPFLRDRRRCPSLHPADIKALEELPPWARETALTFLRAHPCAELGPGEYDWEKWIKSETAWKEGSRRLVNRWIDDPELAAMEAPAVPAPHPDAAPSRAPRGVKTSELLDLKDFVEQLCFRVTTQCQFHARRACQALHPDDLSPSQASRWVRDELERLVNSNPYQHLPPETYERSRCETVERAWRASLIRQVERWIEWHEAAER
jgi:hypothetical protein